MWMLTQTSFNTMIASNVIADHVIIGGADEAFLEVDDGIRDKKSVMDRRSFSSSTSCSLESSAVSKVSSTYHLSKACI